VFAVVLKYLSALILPGFMVVFFTRVAYNHILALVLTVALIAASVYKGYTDSFLLIVVDAFSLTAGFYFANRMMKRNRKRQ
jgi:general stress protein CsbA